MPASAHAEPGTIYIDFDGPTLQQGNADDSRSDTTVIPELATTLDPFGGDAMERAAIVDAVKNDFEPFDVRVVEQRPQSGDFIRVVVTPTNPFGDGVSGAAINDCDDAAGRNDVVFAFFRSGEAPALDVASTISQEVGHSIGLEHVDDAADLLYPIATGVDAYFNDECIDLSSAGSCAQQHAVFCEEADQQNSFAEMLAAFGPAHDDDEPPRVEMVPLEDELIRAGANVDIVVDAEDDTFVDRVELYEDGDLVGEDRAPPYAFTVTEIDEGEYEVYAIAYDAAGNEATSDVLELSVAAASIPADSGAGPVGYPSAPRGTQDEGCGCRHDPGATSWSWLAFVMLLARRRRCD